LDNFSISAFLYGIPIGFLFSFGLGPVFFTLIQSSITYGFRKALYLIIGVVIADLIMLGVAYSGIALFLPKDIDVSFWVELIGGLLLLGLGIGTLMKKSNTEAKPIGAARLIIQNILKGFFLNILNPGNFMEWVATAGILKTKYNYTTSENVSFFTGAILMVIVTEFLIAYFADKLRHIMTEKIIRYITIFTGLLLLGFGIWLLSEAFIKK
jgi:L-lysine exporter family protein LysE/ArgO